MLCLPPPEATGQILIDSGTFVVDDAGDLGADTVLVDDGAGEDATLRIEPGVAVGNGIELTRGGTLDNAGAISRSEAGVRALDFGTVFNRAGGSITSQDSDGVYFGYAGTLVNEAGATISGVNGVYADWLDAGVVDITNRGVITGTTGIGVDMENGGALGNFDGGTITGVGTGALVWGGTVVNDGAGSRISATDATDGIGIEMAMSGSVTNSNGAAIQGGLYGVAMFEGGTVVNSGGATIAGSVGEGIYATGGAAHITNTGDGSAISGLWGVYTTDAGATVINTDGATITGDNQAGVYLSGGGTVFNGAGSTISGTFYSIYASQETTVTNAGTLAGDVRLADQRTNHATIFTGSVIEGDLYVNAEPTSTLTLDGGGTQLFSEAVTGITTLPRGTLIKQGSGTWIVDNQLSALEPAIGAANISILEGTLRVDSWLRGAVAVEDGGTVAGVGRIADTALAAGGAVAPGDADMGTLTVEGDFEQAAGSVYRAQLDPGSEQSDLLAIDGQASLAEGAVLALSRATAGPYAVGARYTVMTAGDGVEGEYAVSTEPLAFLRLSAAYDDNTVFVDIAQVRALAEAAATANQEAVAAGLDSLPDDDPLFAAVVNLPSDHAAQAAFDRLSGEIHASLAGALVEDSRFLREAALRRLREASCPPPVERTARPRDAAHACPSPAGISTWARATGSWGRLDGRGVAAVRSAHGGLFAGADVTAGAGRIGVVAGYGRAELDSGRLASQAEIESFHAGVYGDAGRGALTARFGAGVGWHDLSTSRMPASLLPGIDGEEGATEAAYAATTAQAFGELAYRVHAGATALEPFAALAYVGLDINGFAETGGAAALAGEAEDSDTLFTTLGMRASRRLDLGGVGLTAAAGLGWRRAHGDAPVATVAFAAGESFALRGAAPAADAAVVEARLELGIAANARLGLAYDGQFGRDGAHQGVSGDLVLRF